MIGFKLFFETEEQEDVQHTLNKLPKTHAALVKGYKWRFQPGNILHGDNDHIGMINDKDRSVHVAAPWNYGREFTVLHEIGHRVWARFVNDETKKRWSVIVKSTKKHSKGLPSLDQNDEELFCMAYAAAYAKHVPIAFAHEEWKKFIKGLN